MTDLDEIERLLAKATPGEWYLHDTALSVNPWISASNWTRPDGSYARGGCILNMTAHDERKQDAALIVALRNAAPAMIAELKALRRALEYLNSFGCPKCGGDCSSANPPVMMCPMLEAKAALHPSRRATAMNELIASTADEYGPQAIAKETLDADKI